MSEEESCIICYEEFATSLERGRVRTGCGHSYCAICFAQVMRVSNQCSMCRREITPDVPPSNRNTEVVSDDEDNIITGDPLISDPHSSLQQLLELARFNTYAEIEQLPVYVPEPYVLTPNMINEAVFSLFSSIMREG
jgi:hypothetical protein